MNDDMRDRPGSLHDDPLSKRTHLGNVPFSDLAALNEDTRIMVIGRAAQTKKVSFFVESDACGGDCVGKADRYVRKLRERFPALVVNTLKGFSKAITVIEVSNGQTTKEKFVQGR